MRLDTVKSVKEGTTVSEEFSASIFRVEGSTTSQIRNPSNQESQTKWISEGKNIKTCIREVHGPKLGRDTGYYD
jgi:hypothetical protein